MKGYKPAQPREVAFIASKEGSYPGEGVQALHIETIAFRGDILDRAIQPCRRLRSRSRLLESRGRDG